MGKSFIQIARTLPLILFSAGAAAQENAGWTLERVALNDGRVFHGLVLAVDEKRVEFAEVKQRRGEPMFVVVRPIDRKAVVRVELLSEAERKQLAGRIDRFKHRMSFEALQMNDILLAPHQDGGARRLVYSGRWFDLDCTADNQLTRLLVVRLEQMFLAFRQVLAPRALPDAARPLRVRVFGSRRELNQFASALGLSIENPAFYSRDRNLVVAGADLRTVQAQYEQLQARHQSMRDALLEQLAAWPAYRRQLEAQYRDEGEFPDDWDQISRAAEANLRRRIAELNTRLKPLERRNAAVVEGVIGDLLERLFHESFHAYLETYVYPPQTHDVPRWLNEGLAQIFESGRLEAGVLRIDAPDPERLRQLQADLKDDRPLSLADVIAAPPSAFLVGHAGAARTSSRHYLYSWGLAYHLSFEASGPSRDAVERYVEKGPNQLSPPARFEHLVGMPIDEFERRWRDEMLHMKPVR